MRGKVSKRLSAKAENITVGLLKKATTKKKRELKNSYNEAKRKKVINPTYSKKELLKLEGDLNGLGITPEQKATATGLTRMQVWNILKSKSSNPKAVESLILLRNKI